MELEFSTINAKMLVELNGSIRGGAVLNIDTGFYPLLYPITVSGSTDLGLGLDEGFTMRGPVDPAREVMLMPALPGNRPAALVELNNADFVTLYNLTLVGAQRGLWVHSGSAEFSASHITSYDHLKEGIRIETNSPVSVLDHLVVYNAGTTISDAAIYISGRIGELSNSRATGSPGYGLYLQGTGNALVTGGEFRQNRVGIYVNNNVSGTTTVIGNEDLAPGEGNIVRDNSLYGIEAYGNVLVAGNTVAGHSGSGSLGISLNSTTSTALKNVVYNNQTGIYGYGGVLENRIYNNVTGIRAYGTMEIGGNVIYSNTRGIHIGYYSTNTEVRNNIIYGHAEHGVLMDYGSGHRLINNTIYQPQGNGVTVTSGSNVALRNNIIWTGEGYGISVASGAQVGFASDYNLFYASGNGKVGLWQGVARTGLSQWRNATFTDRESLFAEPLFVDPDGADGVLGYISADRDGRDDDFHVQSLYGSFHGGSLAPVLDPATGLPAMMSGEWVIDPAQSQAIDRGHENDAYDNEPAHNGGYINIGAYGNTAQASKSPEQYILVLRPDGGESLPHKSSYTIAWRSSGFAGEVDIDYSADGGDTFTSLAEDVSNTARQGAFTWEVDPDLFPISEEYLIRMTSVEQPAITDLSNNYFRVTAPISFYYVNDGSLEGDVYTTAVGDDENNNGLFPETPKASIQAILNAYDLGPGDVILVDTGIYNLSRNIEITAADAGVEIRGPVAEDRQAVLDRDNTASGSYVFDLQDADGVILSHLSITGGQYGIYANNTSDSDNVTIEESRVYGNARYGVYLEGSNDDTLLLNNRVYDNGRNSYAGVYLLGARAVISGGVYSGNRTGINVYGANSVVEGAEVTGNSLRGIEASGNGTIVRDNVVYENGTAGIWGGSNVLITGNVVYGHTGSSSHGIQSGSSEVRGNEVFGNTTGISGYGKILENRVYGNTGSGIETSSSSEVARNMVYSNRVGLKLAAYAGSNVIMNNLIYENTDLGIWINYGGNHRVINNTIYQSVGDAILIEGSTISNVSIYNNILWVDTGHTITVATGTQTGFVSDYNLFYLGPVDDTNDHVDRWLGVSQSTLEDWQTASSQDPHSLVGDPMFLDIDGADNVFGGLTVAQGSGKDDNFNLKANSPAIDAANAYVASRFDILDRARKDDPSTENTGTGWDLFVETDTGTVSFDGEIGTAQGWRSGGSYWTYNLPFSFSFYGKTYNTVRVYSNGFLHFEGPDTSATSSNSLEELIRNVRIAPLWDNLDTYVSWNATSYDIYVAEQADSVTIRWKAQQAVTKGEVNFSATLFADGSFRFDYGPGNQQLNPATGPTVSISAGNGFTYVVSGYNAQGDLANANSVLWEPTPGLTYYDIGALEFQGDSSDATPPTVTEIRHELGEMPVSIAPPGTESTDYAFRTILVDFSESLDSISAGSVANYELRSAGPDGVFDNTDDVRFAVRPYYAFPETNLVLELVSGALPDGLYRLTLSGTKAIYDTAGNPLDGNGDGVGGDDYVHYFKIDRSLNIAPEADNPIVSVDEDEEVVIVLSASDADGDPLVYTILTQPLHGTLSGFGPGVEPGTYQVIYTPEDDYNGPDSFRFQVDDQKLGLDEGLVTITVKAVNDVPVAYDQEVTMAAESSRVIVLQGWDLETPAFYLTFTIVDQPDFGDLIQVSHNAWEYVPGEGHTGFDSFTFTVTDRGDPDGTLDNALTSEPVRVTMLVINHPPVIETISSKIVDEGSLLSFTVMASDPDGDGLTFSLDDGPEGAAIDPLTGLFTWTPPNGPVMVAVTVRVTDDAIIQLFDTATFTITVLDVPPVLTVSGAEKAYTGVPYELTLFSEDPGQDTITSWTINWGDGNVTTVTEFEENPFTMNHTYTEPLYFSGDFDEDGDVDGLDALRFILSYRRGEADDNDLETFAADFGQIGYDAYLVTATATDENGTYISNTLPVIDPPPPDDYEPTGMSGSESFVTETASETAYARAPLLVAAPVYHSTPVASQAGRSEQINPWRVDQSWVGASSNWWFRPCVL